MRIIAGKARGTRLGELKGLTLRPTLDRVKESLFNQLAPEIEGTRFLDLFAGTGGIGLEALSRGAAHVVFVEPDSKIRGLLSDNLTKCKFPETDWTVVPQPAELALKELESNSEPFDRVYVDPPFEAKLYDTILNQLAGGTLLAEDARVIVEHHPKQSLQSNYDRLSFIKSRRLGDSVLTFYGEEQGY